MACTIHNKGAAKINANANGSSIPVKKATKATPAKKTNVSFRFECLAQYHIAMAAPGNPPKNMGKKPVCHNPDPTRPLAKAVISPYSVVHGALS